MASVNIKLQDFGYRVTTINRYCLNLHCGLLGSEIFGEISVFNDDTECHYDCGINEGYSNIELKWQHLTSGKILQYVSVNGRNSKFGCNVTT